MNEKKCFFGKKDFVHLKGAAISCVSPSVLRNFCWGETEISGII